MATVTPNFNWPVPTSTDLVRDGATAIEALGDSIDASLVDLKGGTTGQVLSKTSGTDMDFTWVTTDDANAIQNSIVDAKGDLIAASANDTPARLAVGANGETLVADSSTSTGLRWTGQETVGKNAIYNSSLDVWQRGTSFNVTSDAYTADRWYAQRGGIATTVSQQSASLANFTYGIRVQRNSGNTFTTPIRLGQPLEITDAMRFQGKTVTLSFWAKAGANYSATSSALGVFLYSGTGSTDGNPFVSSYTGQATPINSTVTLTTSYQRFSVSVTLGSTVTQLTPAFSFTPVGTAGANDWFEVTGIQLEASAVATTYTRQNATIQGELAACQRYYRRFNAGGSSSYLGFGSAFSTTKITASFYTGTMRITPTTLDYNAINVADGVTGYASTAASLVAATSTPDVANVDFTVASGLTQYRPYFAQANGTTSYVGFSAEL
jgi:hypothetical protein